MNYKLQNLLKRILIAISLIAITGAAVYRLYTLNILGVIMALLLAGVLFVMYIFIDKKYKTTEILMVKKTEAINWISEILWTLPYFLTAIICFFILFKNTTTRAIISPWQVVPSYFFVFYFLASLVLVINIIKRKRLAHILLPLHYILSFLIAVIVYKIGYGFDQFIHQATENLINKLGAVTPKPFYYLGQYALIVITHKITFIPIVWLDKLTVPVLAGIYIPLIFARALKKWFDDEVKINLVVLFLLILPFTIFIVTTPQNLAFLFLLLAILFGWQSANWVDLTTVYIFSLTALVSHPIAGIPAILFSSLLTIYHSDLKKIKVYLYVFLFLITAISLPLAFYYLEKTQTVLENNSTLTNDITTNPVSSTNIDWHNFISFLIPKNPGQENFILNFIYFYALNLKFVIALLAAVGIWLTIKYRQKINILFIYSGLSISLFVSYSLAKNLPYNFLIAYERDNYTDRILIIACLFLLPLISIAIYGVIEKIARQNEIIRTSFLIFFTLLMTVCLYFSYPRYDKYYNSHGFSTGQMDIEAVRWIKVDAHSDYIVLANQQVSAAALREFGFDKYYKIPSPYQGEGEGEVFYYPVPTGGPLYQYYLDMVYVKPSRQTIYQAMDLAGVNQGYFVLNKYWWAFPKILDEAKLAADSWQNLGNGEVYVFKYLK